MDIQKVKLSELTEAPYNPRVELKPGDAEYEKLKKSLEHFGYVEPIVVNKRNMTVIGGHQRLHVMKDLGMEEAEIVYVDLDENDEKALNVALNKISGEWDAEKLKELLDSLNFSGYNLDLTGFDEQDINKLYQQAEDVSLPDDLDDYLRGLTDNEVENSNKIYIKIGSHIKFEISPEEYERIENNYKTNGVDMFKRMMLGVEDLNEEEGGEEEDAALLSGDGTSVEEQ